MDGFIGEVKMFAGTFPPKNWSFCNGALLAISEFTSLFSIIGTQFGGDGRVNFGLPDLRGRVPVGAGYGPSLSPRIQGQLGGLERTQLTTNEMPHHNHHVACDMKTSGRNLSTASENNVPAQITQGEGFGSDLSGGTFMNQDMISSAGQGQPHDNMQPWGCMNYIICLIGEYPPRN